MGKVSVTGSLLQVSGMRRSVGLKSSTQVCRALTGNTWGWVDGAGLPLTSSAMSSWRMCRLRRAAEPVIRAVMALVHRCGL